MMYLITLLAMSILVSALYGYPTGAPAGVCDSMSPNHGGSEQTGSTIYTITPSANTYGCGGSINVTLSGPEFMGFLCQARTNASIYSTVGSLTNTDNSVTTTNNCAGAAAITHSEKAVKTSFQFSWTHSGTSTDDTYIVCTVVHSKLIYWERLTSSAIIYSGSATVCSGAGPIVSSMLLMCACIVLYVVNRFMQ